jgi:Ca2+-binding RTX toxin-like protein
MATIGGTPGNDVLSGTSANDVIFGLEGDDLVSGGLGSDVVDGSSGTAVFAGIRDGFTVPHNPADGSIVVGQPTQAGGEGLDRLTSVETLTFVDVGREVADADTGLEDVAFYADLIGATIHYIQTGFFEGRTDDVIA